MQRGTYTRAPTLSGYRKDERETNERGSSLFDVLVTMALLAILAATALPNRGDLSESFNRAGVLAQVDADLRRTRAEALAGGARAVLLISAGQNSYRVGLDLAPYENTPTIEREAFQTVLPEGITLTASDSIIFDPRGYLVDLNGDPTQRTLNFIEDGTTYNTGTVYAAGYLEF